MGIELLHICEVCGKTEVLDSDEAYRLGWDYPPNMGAFGVVSPRTCGSCGIQDTLWWALQVEKKQVGELTDSQRETLMRILGEPDSVMTVPEPEGQPGKIEQRAARDRARRS